MPVLCVIPARLGSTRLDRKPLQTLGGEPLVIRVWERVRAIGVTDAVVVATDAPEIAEVVERVGGRAVMTSPAHQSGTERVAEVGALAEFAAFDVLVNVQGDEPFLPGSAVSGAVDKVRAGFEVGTAAAPLDPDLATEPGRVKVVLDRNDRALYFSRAPIPFVRDRGPSIRSDLFWQHLGVYAYSRDALARWVRLPVAPLEEAERLEQLRALYYGFTIGVARLEAPALPGIDTPDDLIRAQALWPAHAMGDG